ncbi:GNAT family N-acetyltransferase [Streptomyces sp. VRA16 Mangrove soil]|uniref:GNAT family N-acetyltransferase n=1 Tax=Streptomyces sp. VRA16 Mangrove soil TaxID=2817434 RepID=UPI001A9EFEE3|nr:GNAT family N-acetyltransferase [Streptomyces sp. VRA16 Mangrove soil]MBO1331134.1 GNAT family N-acetyltransferase [Streptomyces sp. VRA16 Mangrove soil]
MVDDMVRTWVAGWAVSRGTPPPAERPWGYYIEVADDPAEVGRHVLPEASRAAVRAAAEAVTVPRTWMKMPAEPDEVEPWITPGWEVARSETGYLMAVDLTATGATAPAGYTAHVERAGDVVRVRVRHAAGGPAAAGQLALLGEDAVVDRIRTQEAHRRRGLGAFVMRALADRAVELGAVRGVLGATPAGRALYRELGWRQHATLAECVYRG